MTKETPDDLEAVRAVVASLKGFEPKDQERIIRWAREKLGLAALAAAVASDKASAGRDESQHTDSSIPRKQADIKTFVDLKKPQTDIQFASAVAYYYRFEAPESLRKASITAADLQEACRQTGRLRFKGPSKTLGNAHQQGYLDKGGERGTYVVNTVGENLVAMALPEGAGANQLRTVTGRKKRV
jgi:hypothetical protein